MPSEPWKVSLHGGHSGEFCEHATSTLREVLEAAVACGYQTFGVSEHAPRSEDRFLYPSEREKGYTVERLRREFEAYAGAMDALAQEFDGRLVVLRGFEAEVIPTASYAQEMLGWQERFGFDYMVGSVHYVDEVQIDGEKADFEAAVGHSSGLEPFAVRYYDTVARMVETLQPDVVGHLDLIRRNAASDAVLDTPAIREAAETRPQRDPGMRCDPRPQYRGLPQRPRLAIPRSVARPPSPRDGRRLLLRRRQPWPQRKSAKASNRAGATCWRTA